MHRLPFPSHCRGNRDLISCSRRQEHQPGVLMK
uniref:Uncharacterized protein n=1 Tax=Anguilla anguilla TaxID=7936 RepID=A0A0E9UTP8_ANGAN